MHGEACVTGGYAYQGCVSQGHAWQWGIHAGAEGSMCGRVVVHSNRSTWQGGAHVGRMRWGGGMCGKGACMTGVCAMSPTENAS